MRHRDRLDQRAELADVRDDRAADELEAQYAAYADRDYVRDTVLDTTPRAVLDVDGHLDYSTRTPPAPPSPTRWPDDKRLDIRKNRVTGRWMWAVGFYEHDHEMAYGYTDTWADALDLGLRAHADIFAGYSLPTEV